MGSNGAGNTYRLRPIIAFQSTSPCGEQRGKDATGGPSPEISIHIPVWGATSSSLPTLPGVTDFNPHPRVGSNQQRRGRGPQQRAISIHIPVWRATQWAIGGPRGPHTPDFNPHPRVGSNGEVRLLQGAGCVTFQSTSPCGEQPPKKRRVGHRKAKFQSTSPCGEQPDVTPYHPATYRISIHIPVWGATGLAFPSS